VSLVRAVVLGGLTVGVLDGLDAVIFFGLRGVAPGRIFQAIAAGLLGPAAFQGGARTVALGVVLHFCIAATIVAVACLLVRRLPRLGRRPLPAGAVYGVGVWLVMNFIVIPLSAARSPARSLAVVVNGLLIHVVGVGIPALLFARRVGR
jgi:hypothetical protein